MWHKCLVGIGEISVAPMSSWKKREKHKKTFLKGYVRYHHPHYLRAWLCSLLSDGSSLCFSFSYNIYINLCANLTPHHFVYAWVCACRDMHELVWICICIFLYVAHTFASNAGFLEVHRIVWFVIERHLLDETVSFSLPSVISTMLIIRPRAASTLIHPKTLMGIMNHTVSPLPTRDRTRTQ